MLVAKEIIILLLTYIKIYNVSIISYNVTINMMTFYAYIMIMFGLLWPVIDLCFQCDELR